MRKLPVIVITAVLVLLLVAAVGTAVLMGSGSSSGADAAATPADPAAPAEPATPGQPSAPAPGGSGQQGAPTSVAFLGDGYTAETPDGGQGPANYTTVLGARDGLQVTNVSAFGSGYVATPTLQSRLPQVVAGGPQLVVVTAGRADDQSDPAAVGTAAGALYQDIKTQLPQAKVVVIGPMWLESEVPAEGIAVRDAIRDAATQAQLPFVDPIAERWFNGQDQDGVGSSGLVLNDAGHQRLSQLVEESLKRSGALPG